ncbi:MAG: DUF2752 domain-containing protein [Desulfobacteraceae bacterium]|nr:MAG: DUF2752 domain-containing protein [Desulfobacteraceae bacterium]
MVFGICFSILLLTLVLGRIDWIYERIIGENTGLPGLCIFRNTTGLPCPGCGLTRAFVSAAHGNFALSLYFHRLGWLIIFYTILQMLRHVVWLALTGRRLFIERLGFWLDRALIPIAILLIINWFYNLARIFKFIS